MLLYWRVQHSLKYIQIKFKNIYIFFQSNDGLDLVINWQYTKAALKQQEQTLENISAESFAFYFSRQTEALHIINDLALVILGLYVVGQIRSQVEFAMLYVKLVILDHFAWAECALYL